MGQKKNSGRKLKDQPIIRIPSIKLSGTEINNLPEMAANTCIPSFEEPLEESPFAKENLRVDLLQRGEKYLIMVQGSEICVLSKRNSNRVTECLRLRVKYVGTIIKKKDKYYARFIRQTD